ncbi:uncharacterized protein LOC116010698 [Ipomoea triloba]|uniref:uncharacterized protein LOC116010698 n=1 Tax=Ipomoea triloba TaxID=35885 RepID=UPI00125CFCA2|nr:uncharacterized protein LOC116010698 [Ipomoea triloba]XP_031106075.1 uncharacterized protein LOC116010698 [Ipomoea triloba]
MMNKFWWDATGGPGGGIRWMAWGRMCSPKIMGGMGFKSLNKFNIALLAKQGWRLLSKPDSLPAKMLKARYYPTGEFLSASIGSNPSYTWRSILAGQEILQRGCYKRIGNARCTCVWKQPWLPDEVDPYVQSPVLDNDANLKYEDQWCWRGDIRGVYTVRNGYRLLTNVQGISEPVIWRGIWKLKIPPNIRISACNPHFVSFVFSEIGYRDGLPIVSPKPGIFETSDV